MNGSCPLCHLACTVVGGSTRIGLLFAGTSIRPALKPVGTQNTENEYRKDNQKLSRFTHRTKNHGLTAFSTDHRRADELVQAQQIIDNLVDLLVVQTKARS
jgi:hypothetical protein